MSRLLNDRLKRIESKYGKKPPAASKRLKVYYGWRKLSKTIKRESLTVIFLNDMTGPRIGKDDNDGVTRFINIAHCRWQTKDEMKDAESSNRIYSVYEIYMDDKNIQGSLQMALQCNYNADKNNVCDEERQLIRDKLREAYMMAHPDYKEPQGVQMFFNL